MKQQYTKPELVIMVMEYKDVICTSGVSFDGEDNLTQWNDAWGKQG